MATQTASGTFDAAGQSSAEIPLAPGQSLALTLLADPGTESSTVVLTSRRGASDTRVEIQRWSGAALDEAATYVNRTGAIEYLRLTADVIHVVESEEEEVDYTLASAMPATGVNLLAVSGTALPAAEWTSTVGGAVGFLDQNETDAVCILPINLPAGTVVKGAAVLGLLGAGTGEATTLEAVLYRRVAGAAAEAISSTLAVTVEADTTLGVVNGTIPMADHVVAPDETLYLELTGTTADDAACDIEVSAVLLWLA